MSKKNVEVQLIRGILCFLVVFYHWTLRYSEIVSLKIPETLTIIASTAVFIGMCGFCIISGFYAVNPNKKTGSIVSYLIKRIVRLYPGYLISIAVIFCLTHVIKSDDLPRSVTLSDFLLNIPFLHLVLRRNWVDGAHWYVIFSIVMCFLIGIFRFTEKLYKNKWVWRGIFLVLSGGVIVTEYIAYKMQLYIFYVLLMFAGAYFRKNEANSRISVNGDLIILTILTFVCAVFCKSIISATVLIVVLWYILNSLISNRMQGISERRAMQLCFLGDRSYNIYLIHQNIGFLIIHSCTAHGMPYCEAFIIALIVVIALASLIYVGDVALQARLYRMLEKR